jgi:hypothetical protein
MNKYIRYINWFNNHKKICIKNNKHILSFECPYEFNVKIPINQILVNYNNYKYSYFIEPKIINYNDVKK